MIISYSEGIIKNLEDYKLEDLQEAVEIAAREDSQADLVALRHFLSEMGYYDQVQYLLRAALKKDPADDAAKIELSEILIEEGQDQDAFELLFSIEESSDSYLASLLVQADLYMVQGLYEVSEQKLKEALAIAGDQADLIEFALAELYFTTNRFQEANRLYQKLIQAGHETINQVNLMQRLGQLTGLLGHFEKSMDYFEKSLDSDESIDSYFQYALSAYQIQDYPTAIKNFQQVLDLDKSYSSVYPLLARSFEKNKEADKARATVQEGLVQDQTNEDLYLLAAQYAREDQELEEADRFYQAGLEINPLNSKIRLEYFHFMLSQGQYEELLAAIQESSEMEEFDPHFYWLEALARNELEDFALAKEAFIKAYPYFSDHEDFMKDYIYFTRDEGDRELLTELLEDYLFIAPHDAEMLYLKASLEEDEEEW